MDNLLFGDYFWTRPMFPELADEIRSGSIYVWEIASDCYRVFAFDDKTYTYSEKEVQVRKVKVREKKLTIYVIETNDGHFKGTALKYDTQY
jgi:hypothetical protein